MGGSKLVPAGSFYYVAVQGEDCLQISCTGVVMSKGAKTAATAVRLPVVPGLVPADDGTGYRLDVWQVEPSGSVFMATGFRTKVVDDQFVMLFGTFSSFEEEPKRFDLAVELYLPVGTGLEQLVESVWERESTRRGEKFVETLARVLTPAERAWAEGYDSSLLPPARKEEALRSFPVHAVAVSLRDKRGYLEFFSVPVSLVSSEISGRARKGDGVRSVLFVVVSAKLLYAFLDQARKARQRGLMNNHVGA